MEVGVSIYSGVDYDLVSSMQYIDMVCSLGVSRIFTSFNAVVYDKTSLDNAIKIIRYAKSKHMNIMTDVSPKVFQWIGADITDLTPIYQMGITDIRCDYGFGVDDIAKLSRNNLDISIVINASTATHKWIEDIVKHGGQVNSIKACHNFYPRPYTGLSKSFFEQKTAMLKAYGMEISAFIPSQASKRGPLYEGLPTMEHHRSISPIIAAKELAYSRMVDTIYFGDAYASSEELKGALSVEQDIIELEIQLFDNISEVEKDIVFSPCHINRLDASEYIVRSSKPRSEVPGRIVPFNSTERCINTVTIDNEKMGRYMGELQITRRGLPADPRVNVVGSIDVGSVLLLDYIYPGSKFKFIRKDD